MVILWQADTGGHDCPHTGLVALPWTAAYRSPHGVSPGSSTREHEAPSARNIADQVVAESTWLVPVPPSLDWDSLPAVSGGKLGLRLWLLLPQESGFSHLFRLLSVCLNYNNKFMIYTSHCYIMDVLSFFSVLLPLRGEKPDSLPMEGCQCQRCSSSSEK